MMVYDHWQYSPVDENAVQTLQNSLPLEPAVCRILAQMGITDPASAQVFLRPDLGQLHDPFLMADMHRAVNRLQHAVQHQEHILLYGDYDADGVCGVAMCFDFLKSLHSHVDFYIPRRDTEGYGISSEGIEYARSKDCTLMIAIDCGIRDAERIAAAQSVGIDVVVCDHHLPSETLPPAFAVLDPLRPDCLYPFKGLSGCGVAFKLLQGFAKKQGISDELLHHQLDLLALSTACDLMPMTGENRLLTTLGLRAINRTRRVGLRALWQQSHCNAPLGVRDLVFKLGPLLNAAGRMGDAADTVRLLLATDRHVAQLQAGKLALLNKARRDADYGAFEQAYSIWDALPEADVRRGIVLSDPLWQPGVLGIVAARMAERYGKPAVLLGLRNGEWVGSARGVQGISVEKALMHADSTLSSWGGHAQAAGLRLAHSQLDVFAAAFEQGVRLQQPDGPPSRILHVSSMLSFDALTAKLAKQIELLGPFGPGHRSPVFVAEAVRDTGQSRRMGQQHILVHLQQGNVKMEGIGFGLAEAFEKVRYGAFDIAFGLRNEHWHGHSVVRLQIKDVRPRQSKGL
jgi:single-stranded-DNA-specific exonuclease